MNEHFRTEAELRTTPYSATSAAQYLTKITNDGRYASTRNNNLQPKKSMQKYFPAAPSREKNPSYSKIKPLQSRGGPASQPTVMRSQEFEPGMTRNLPAHEQRRDEKKSDRQSTSSPKHHSNMLINGKEMSTTRLIGRIHQNLQSLEAMIESLYAGPG